ncbi:hypothetical protein FBUS_02529 [Fasciolopsis buskii]|uniref:Uncharacterized protein n=1 Tax=Fasciolopsis buskii TaxID=27845 RepID=A0A8E0S4W5_9TREM|nr:hypothetical protein FBUS_02529 [Fasciolopsis buski]
MKAFLCIMPCVLRNLRQNPFNRILCSQTRAFEMRNTYAMSRVQVHQVPKANWMARAIGHVASATKLPEPFSAESLQSHLRALRTLVQAEAKNGRWPVDFTNIESNSVENLLIQPLSKAWNLEAKIIWDLVSFVCTASDPLLSGCDEIAPSNDINYIRLELLNPARVTVNLFDPLTHIGIQQPQKILAKCPSLLLASAIPCVTQSDHSNGLIGGLKTTVLLEALEELGSLLGRNDLILLINRYPGYLVNSYFIGEQRLKKLLTAPAKQVCQWLNSITPKQNADGFPDPSPNWDTKYQAPISLTKDDVKAFESLILQINCGGRHSVDRKHIEPSSSLSLDSSAHTDYERTDPESGANSNND